MGNKILTQYDVNKEPCYYSTELKWRLHSATYKEKPEEALTIFLFEKKGIEKYAKNTRELIIEVLRKDASSLQRLRHPQILSVVEALVDERSTLAFATKPVVGTVAQLLDHNRHELSGLEMKCGILDIAEALCFLHQDAKTAHLGISPNSVFIDQQGKWLLGGLGNSLSGVQWGQLVDCPFAFASNDPPGTLSHEPPPKYAAPEMVQMPCKCGLESDMFSLGLLVYELMSNERQPLLRGAPRGYQASVFRQSSVPKDLYGPLAKLLSASPTERLTIAAFIQSEFFMDVSLRAIRFLETLHEKEEAQRVTFLRGLPKLLEDPQSPLCSHRVLRERVLPRLCSALLFDSLYGLVVPVIFTTLKREKVTDSQFFQARIWPSVKPLFTASQVPIEVVSLFLRELDVLVTNCTPEATQAVLLPFVLRCLELQEPAILQEVLEKVPYLHKKFEYRQMKDAILPRMLQLMLQSPAVKVKVQVLMGLGRIFEIFDKNTIVDVLLPAFDKLTKSDRTPAICMCLLGCYDAMSKHLGHKVTAEKILPLIFPMLAEESLSGEQWETQMSVCKKLMQRVEAARRKEYSIKSDQQAEAGDALGGKADGLDMMSGGGAGRGSQGGQAEPLDFNALLMGSGAKVPVQAAAPPPCPVLKAPPPPSRPAPGTSVGGGASPSFDLLGGGAPGGGAQLNLLGGPTPSAPSMGGFDPFATSTTRAAPAPAAQGSFDPFAGAGAPAGAAGGFGGLPNLNFPPGPPAAGASGFGGLAFPPSNGPCGMPGQGMVGQGMPGQGQGMPGQGQSGMRNMSYDPFAEIEGRPAGAMGGGLGAGPCGGGPGMPGVGPGMPGGQQMPQMGCGGQTGFSAMGPPGNYGYPSQ